MLAILTTLILDCLSYKNIKSRTINANNHQNPNASALIANNLINSNLTKNMPSKQCNINTSVKSTLISTVLFLSTCFLFITANLTIIPPVHMYVNTVLIINIFRVPLILILTVKKNSTNAFQSRTKRQEWEMEHARKERLERSQVNIISFVPLS